MTIAPGRPSAPFRELVSTHVSDAGAASHLLDVGRRYLALLIGLPLLLALIVGVLGLTRPRTYTATASFTPSSTPTSPSSITSLAEQFGVNVRSGSASQSPPFYGDLIRSRAILEPVADTSYATTPNGPARSLADLFEVPATATPALRRDMSLVRLGEKLAVSVKRETGVISFAVTTRWPQVSAAVARHILAQVDRFNLETRQSQAKAERRFVEQRLQEARAELRTLQDQRLSFVRQNRDATREGFGVVTESGLTLQRLESDLRSHEQVVSSLAQAYEQARIDEVRDTPAITVVEEPEPPVRPDGRGLARSVGLALVLGFGLAVALAFGREWWRAVRAETA